jgi:hypothetical protein
VLPALPQATGTFSGIVAGFDVLRMIETDDPTNEMDVAKPWQTPVAKQLRRTKYGRAMYGRGKSERTKCGSRRFQAAGTRGKR